MNELNQTATAAPSGGQKIKLIREFFGASMQEIKALTPEDRNQLGTAVAREHGMTETEAGFAFVQY